jgi:hypothetical protein
MCAVSCCDRPRIAPDADGVFAIQDGMHNLAGDQFISAALNGGFGAVIVLNTISFCHSYFLDIFNLFQNFNSTIDGF